MPPSLPRPPRRGATPRRHLDVAESADEAAQRCAAHLATHLSTQLATQMRRVGGHPTVAFSGGSTPTVMFGHLARLIAVDRRNGQDWWRDVEVFQVDERIAPDGDEARNAVPLTSALLDPADTPERHRHLIDVNGDDPAGDYARLLRQYAPSGLDIAVLGLGDDGHTASLVPGDPVVDELISTMATTGPYRGHTRVTMTRPTLDQAHALVWLITGGTKVVPLRQLLAGDRSIPAGLLVAPEQTIFTDRDAMGDA